MLIDHIADKFQADEGVDLRKEPMALQRLREAAEKAKKELSSSQSTDINLPFIAVEGGNPKHLQMTISRSEFERLVDGLVERCRKPVLNALADADLKPGDIDEVVLVGGSTRIPKVQELVKKLFGKEPHKGVNPDEVVAIGAAIQGAIIAGAGEYKDILLLDVTPLSLGIETEGGVMTKLIERNTTIPFEKKETFSTAADNQTAVTVRVFQGERPMATDNRILGEFNLDGIPPAPRGVPQVEVTFDIDKNGILHVKAADKATGKEQSVTIDNSSGLSEDEISKMQKDAEAHADEDKKKRELAQVRNQASTMAYETEKLIKEHADKLDEGSKTALESSIEKVHEAEKGEDVDKIKAAIEELTQASHALSKAMYESQAKESAATGADGAPPEAAATEDEGEVIDAEFEKKE